MENAHVEIHDPISRGNERNSSADSCSDAEDVAGTPEYRLMMAFATRRRPRKDDELSTADSLMVQNCGTDTNEKGQVVKKMKKMKKKSWKKRLPSILRCIRPQTVDDKPPQTTDGDDRSFVPDKKVKKEEKDKFEEVASRLTAIADEVPFIHPGIETDTVNDVEKVIGLLLRDAGDKLNQEELNKALRASEIFWSYSFYKMLIRTLLERMGLVSPYPESLGPQASPKTQIAVTCEVTSRLSAVDTVPMNRMLGHGARYLQENYSSWVQQQGGYEEAFYSEDEDGQ